MDNAVIISVGGGKGGVGKSTITANIGALLVRNHYSVGFIDADLGGANLHLCLGVRRPLRGLQDYLTGKYKTLEEITVPVSLPNSWLISGASDILELANPRFSQKQKIIRNIAKMEADFVLVDLGAGSDNHVTDFYAAFPCGIIVTDGLPTSIENAYGFLKNGVLRGLVRLFSGNGEIVDSVRRFSDPQSGRAYATVGEMIEGLTRRFPRAAQEMRRWLQRRRTFLVLNMVKESEDVRVGERFAEMVKKYLSLNIYYIGYIVFSPDVRKSIKTMRPLVEYCGASRAAECFAAVTNNLIALTKGCF
ncbi:MAG: P-loop NTPase [Chitinispirillaceae bacterium]|nr:P-loop NTPase [Chitinispirillaceae bacterium]